MKRPLASNIFFAHHGIEKSLYMHNCEPVNQKLSDFFFYEKVRIMELSNFLYILAVNCQTKIFLTFYSLPFQKTPKEF